MDINKPLINTVLIGRFEQEVVYEGIHKLCFACGRIGHKKDDCPHTIRKPVSPEREENGEPDESTRSRKVHATDSTTDGCGTSGGSGAATDSTSYRPWMIVTHKKSGQRSSVNAATKEGHTGLGKAGTDQAYVQGSFSKAEKMG